MLKVKNLSVSAGGTDILENISFEVKKGEYVSIVGENGSGKSTLLKTVLGQFPKKSGTVEFSPYIKNVGYLPQQTLVKNFPATVYEVVLSGCLKDIGIKPFFTKSEKALVRENMKRLNIEGLSEKSFSTLSGGQRQRVLLARAMCAGKDMLILDEPVTGLDPVVTLDLYRAIKELNREKGVTVLTVSHDISAAAEYSSKILHIDKTVRFFGTSKEYTESELGIHFTGRCCSHV